jgi:hypothetical protein
MDLVRTQKNAVGSQCSCQNAEIADVREHQGIQARVIQKMALEEEPDPLRAARPCSAERPSLTYRISKAPNSCRHWAAGTSLLSCATSNNSGESSGEETTGIPTRCSNPASVRW